MPVSEASDTAHTRVIHAGETSLQEYVIRPGEQVGDWFSTDGEVIHYVIEGAITLEIEGLGIWELGTGDAVAHPGALRNRWHLRGEDSARVAVRVHRRLSALMAGRGDCSPLTRRRRADLLIAPYSTGVGRVLTAVGGEAQRFCVCHPTGNPMSRSGVTERPAGNFDICVLNVRCQFEVSL